MAVVRIKYLEGDPTTYKSVEISFSGREENKFFDSGNFVKDWFDCNEFIVNSNLSEKEPISNSSTVNHFFMDGAPFDSAYLKMIDNKGILYYTYDDEGWEFFVPTGTNPTWEELKEMCDHKKKK